MRSVRFLRNRRGVALIEFAIVLPVLMLLFFGGFTMASGMAFNRKLSVATRALADLTSQRAAVDRDALSGIVAMGAPIVVPYRLANGLTRVSQVVTDGNGDGRIDWSYAGDGTALARNAAYPLPSDVRFPNTAYLVAEMRYPFRPLASLVPLATIPLGENVIMLPRKSSSVPCTDCY